MKKRILSMLLACMLLNSLPVAAFAEEVQPECSHVCDESCGYVAPAAAVACDKDCKPAEEGGEVTHVEGCAYKAAEEGSPCTHKHNGECGVECAHNYVDGKCACGAECTHNYEEGICTVCGMAEPCEHTGGTATCEVLAVCDTCGEGYGELADHAYGEDGKCACGAECTHNYEEGVCTVCGMAEPKPVCNCGTDDASIHATTCAMYAAPEKPECHCVEKCLEANIWCDVCGIDYSLCGGTGKAEAYTEHKHCLSVHEDCTDHEDAVTWTAWEKTDSLPTSGNYYLTADVTLRYQHTVSSTLNLCLNGHTIKPSGSSFGAIRITGNLSLTDCSKEKTGMITGFTNNSTGQGGAVYVASGKQFTMYGGTISGNIAGMNDLPYNRMGGGVYSEGTFTMYGGTISGNTSKSYGGGVYSKGTFEMYGGTISGNIVEAQYYVDSMGGGVYSSGTFTMEGGTISNNVASYYGGGVYVAGSNFTMSGGTISGNKVTVTGNAQTYGGGGVYVAGSNFTMSGGTISGNEAGRYGGGVCIGNNNYDNKTSGTFTMEGGTISNNVASYYGGGVYIDSLKQFTMEGGTITGNTADRNGGGVFMYPGAKAFNLSGSPIIRGNTGGNCYIENKDNCFITAGALSDNAEIGITTWSSAPSDPFCMPANSVDLSNYKNRFFSDIIGYNILLNSDDGSLYTKQVTTYTLTLNFDTTKAKVTVRGIETKKAAAGDIVVISPKGDAVIESVTATGCEVSKNENGTYSFEMPANAVTITVVEKYDLWVGGVEVTSQNTSGEGWSYNRATKTLTLNNAAITGSYKDANIYTSENLNIVLEGSNSLASANQGIKVDGANTLTISGTGTLAIQGHWDGIKVENGSVVITGANITSIAEYSYGVQAAKLTIDNSVVTIEGGVNTNALTCNDVTFGSNCHVKITSKGNAAFSTVPVTADGWYRNNAENGFGNEMVSQTGYFEYLSKNHVTLTDKQDDANHTVSCAHGVSFEEAHQYVEGSCVCGAKKSYTITFNTDGGTKIEDIVGASGMAVTAPANPTKTGYTFAGWDKEIPTTMPAENVTITATWTANSYDAIFNADGGAWADGETTKTVSTAFGSAIVAPADPAKTGYTFAGWDKEIPTTMPAENVTIKAKWTANSYDAIFNADGGAWADGETTKTVPTAFGSVIVAPADPAKTGYIFAGWTPAVGNMDSVDGKAFTATWTINQYTVTFKVDGETVEAYTQTVNHGGNADMTKEIPHKVGYDDKSPIWSIDGVNAADGKNITADTEFSAVYFQNSPGTYEDTTDSSGNAAAVEIETPIQDLMDAVPLTQEELQQVALGEDVKFWMVSADGSSAISAEDRTLVDKARSGDIVGMYLDIDLFKQIGDNNPVQVTSLDEKIAVTLDVPASLINSNNKKIRTYYVIRVHNGATTVINPTFDAANRTLTFKTDRFSTYAISYVDTTKPDIVKTGDESQMGLWMSIFAFSTTAMAVLLVLNKKKHGKYARK